MARLLLWLSPEVAHWIASQYLRIYQVVYFRVFRRKLRRGFGIKISHLPTLKFPSRIGLAAGFDKNAEMFAGLASLGFGFVEVGTVTPLAQCGNSKPRLWRLSDESLINHMGFNNCGAEAFQRHLARYRRYVPELPLFANLGKGRATALELAIEDYRSCLLRLQKSVDGFVINVSSPNTPQLRSLQNVAFLEAVARIAPKGTLLFMKFSPDLEDLVLSEMFDFIARESSFSGVVLSNTSVKLAAERFGKQQGGYSGPLLFPRTLECVALARKHLGNHRTIIGVGGVASVEQALSLREAGADLVEIYTAFIYQGPRLVRELSQALR